MYICACFCLANQRKVLKQKRNNRFGTETTVELSNVNIFMKLPG